MTEKLEGTHACTFRPVFIRYTVSNFEKQMGHMHRPLFIRYNVSNFEEHLKHDIHEYIDNSLVDYKRRIWSSP